MTLTTHTSLITFIAVLFLHISSARAEPSKELNGMDDPETRAKVLTEAVNQFTKNKEYEKAFDAASAAHMLKPTLHRTCVAASLAQQIGQDVRAAELFTECMKFAIEENFKKSKPERWPFMQADYDCAMSRVGILRIHAPPLTTLTVDDRSLGLVDGARDIFVDPKISHKVVARSEMGVVIERSVGVGAGERHDVEFKREDMQPAKEPATPMPAPLPPVYVPQRFQLVPDPYAQPAYAVDHVPAGSWAALGGGIVMAAATIYFAHQSRVEDAHANTMAAKLIRDQTGKCDQRRNPFDCLRADAKRAEADRLFNQAIVSGAASLSLFGLSAAVYAFREPSPQAGSAQKLSAGFSLRGTW